MSRADRRHRRRADPFFSPDGSWIGFFARGSLQKIPVSGGVPTLLCAARAGMGATWSQDGTIVFGGGPGGGLARVSATGGEPFVLASPLEGSRELRYGWPDLLPDSRGIVYTAVSLASSDVFAIDLRSGIANATRNGGGVRTLLPTGSPHRRTTRATRSRAVLTGSLTTTREPPPIVTGPATADVLDGGPRSPFRKLDRSFMYRRTSGSAAHALVGRTRTAQRVRLRCRLAQRVEPRPISGASRSRWMAKAGPDLWLGDLTAGAASPADGGRHSVSPRGGQTATRDRVRHSKAGPFNVPETDRWQRRCGSADHESVEPVSDVVVAQFATARVHRVPTADQRRHQGRSRHARAAADRSHPLRRETSARFSPDGRWMAHVDGDRPMGGTSATSAAAMRVRYNSGGGRWPCWSIDGRTLFRRQYSARPRSQSKPPRP